MQGGVVGQRAIGAHPDLLIVGGLAVATERVAAHVAQIDRSRPVVPLAHALLVRCHARLEVGQRVGSGHVEWHRQLVVGPGLGHVEAGLQVEDGAPVLNGDDATGGEAAPVADAIDLVEDGHGGVARPQEVRVQ